MTLQILIHLQVLVLLEAEVRSREKAVARKVVTAVLAKEVLTEMKDVVNTFFIFQESLLTHDQGQGLDQNSIQEIIKDESI